MLNITTPEFGQSMALIRESVIDELRRDLEGIRNIHSIPKESDKLHRYITVIAWGNFHQLYSTDLEKFSEYTKVSREGFSQDLKFGVDLFKIKPGLALHFILKMLNEYYFWFKDENSGINPELADYDTYKSLNELNGSAGEKYNCDYEWVRIEFPLSIARDFVFSTDFIEVKGLVNKYNNDNETLTKSIADIGTETKKIDELARRLSEYKNQVNFLGLNKAFSAMKKSKAWELWFALSRFWIFSLLLIGVPILTVIYLNVTEETTWKMLMLHYAPIITLELLLLYFMRLFYSEAKAIKAQLLQVDHRMALCAFIQEYVTYRENNQNSKEAFEGFENLIFSPVQAKEDNIPSMLDGAGAIADLMGKVIAKGKAGA